MFAKKGEVNAHSVLQLNEEWFERETHLIMILELPFAFSLSEISDTKMLYIKVSSAILRNITKGVSLLYHDIFNNIIFSF